MYNLTSDMLQPSQMDIICGIMSLSLGISPGWTMDNLPARSLTEGGKCPVHLVPVSWKLMSSIENR